MLKKSLIDKSMKTYVVYNNSNPIETEFVKLYYNYKKEKSGCGKYYKLFTEATKFLSGKSGYAGSGFWLYSFKNKVFSITGCANGKNFWGTNYCINQESK